ncbi:MAG: hypothetical protein KDA45_04100, partial [Planctomycetales bacterium]|nr:hypothetical protein [Planctomycetales bacterium]
YPGAGWSEASTGPGGRQLADQAWDGFQFNALGFGNGQPPGTAFTAIPEPGGMLFVALLAVRCFGRRRTAYSQPWATAL